MCYVSGSTSTPSEINIELHIEINIELRINLTWRFTKGNREGGRLNLVPSSFTRHSASRFIQIAFGSNCFSIYAREAAMCDCHACPRTIRPDRAP